MMEEKESIEELECVRCGGEMRIPNNDYFNGMAVCPFCGRSLNLSQDVECLELEIPKI